MKSDSVTRSAVLRVIHWYRIKILRMKKENICCSSLFFTMYAVPSDRSVFILKLRCDSLYGILL
jgi:hypothetical protein